MTTVFGQTSEINIMAKKSVNKSALVRDYLAKYPETVAPQAKAINSLWSAFRLPLCAIARPPTNDSS